MVFYSLIIDNRVNFKQILLQIFRRKILYITCIIFNTKPIELGNWGGYAIYRHNKERCLFWLCHMTLQIFFPIEHIDYAFENLQILDLMFQGKKCTYKAQLQADWYKPTIFPHVTKSYQNYQNDTLLFRYFLLN